ncbi:MAG TPA: methyltransferase domain-containing protein [Solirubrobacteraceae bacterium]|jgi:23S rRNA (guanine745-N1)-methyltransferase
MASASTPWETGSTSNARAAPRAMALAAIASRLRCPNCGCPLRLADSTLLCGAGHSFDLARQGYVSLLPARGRFARGDTSAMVLARETFLAGGHYAPIARAVASAARSALATPRRAEHAALDAGAGTGYYLAAVLEALPRSSGIALDASRAALRRAARAHPRVAAIACDVWRELPLQAGSADLLLNVFAPRNGPEIARVLAPEGTLIVVTPTPRHLSELVAPFGLLEVDADKPARLQATLATHVKRVEGLELEFDMTLSHAEIRALIAMGPSAHHLNAEEIEGHLAELPDAVAVGASVIIQTYRPS